MATKNTKRHEKETISRLYFLWLFVFLVAILSHGSKTTGDRFTSLRR